MKRLATRCCASIALVSLLAGVAGAQNPPAPPRTIADVAALIDQYKPDLAAAAAARATLEKKPPEPADDRELARHYLERIAAAARLGDQAERLKAARAAGALANLGNLAYRVLDEWANAEEQSGNLLEGIRLRELIRGRETAATGGRIAANAVLADTYAGLGDLAAGRRLLADSESMYLRLGRQPIWQQNEIALMERQRGDVYAREGKYAEAEAAYRKAFAAAENDIELSRQRIAAGMSTPSQDVIVSMRNLRGSKLSSALLNQGNVAEAEYYARDVLRNALEWSGRGHPRAASALALLGDVMLVQGRFAEAETLARASLDSLGQAGISGASVSLAYARGRLAITLVAQERWHDALAEFERRNQGVDNAPELLRFLGGSNLSYAIALYQTGQFAKAVAILNGLHRWWLENFGPSHLMSATTLAFGALSRAGLGGKEQALRELAEALPILIEQTRGDQSEDRGGYVRTLRFKWIAEGYLRLLGEAARSSSGKAAEDAAAEAFRIADIARGSSVQRALAASAARASIRDPQLAELARREQDAGQRVGALSGILSSVLARPADQQLPQVIADMRRDIDALAAERRTLKKQIEEGFPEYSNLTEPRPVTLAQARSALQPGEALVSIYAAAKESYVWAFTRDGDTAFAIIPPGAKEIASRVARLREALDVGDVPLARFPRFDLGLAHELYAMLLKPVESGWAPAARLLVVAHGALGQLPFSLLATEPFALRDGASLFDGYRAAPWLLRKAAVSQLPSVNALVTLRNLPAPRTDRSPFTGFGDPRFAAEALASAGTVRGIRKRNLSVGTTDSEGRPVASNEIRNLAPLPDTADEIREMAALMGADPGRDVYLGLRASETNVKAADLSRSRVLAFATHGLVPGDLNGLTEPALALSNPELTGEKESDGLLTLSEVLSLKLDADWVVLSACNTAAADGAAAEAVSGLGRGFFYAGARALLVSNWPVETVSARLLTTDVFRRQSADPKLTRAEALRSTMLDLIDSGSAKDAGGKVLYSYAHPMFWAPFSLVGDGGR
jgi:CHAT domain-containing protein